MKTGIIAAALVVLLAVGGFVFLGGNDDDDNSNSEMNDTSSEQANIDGNDDVTVSVQNNSDETTETERQITAAMVAEHASESDCWTIVDGSVYDITSYVPRHPGGDEILTACGTDGTSLFNERTTTDGEAVGSGRPHSASATNLLDDLKIGTLMQ